MFFFAISRFSTVVRMSRIRSATPSDEAFVADCARRAYEIYVPRIGKEPAPMVADFKTLIGNGDVFVAENAEGVVCGFIIFRRVDDHVLLENVAVDPDHHGSGHGRALIDFVEAFAVSQGIGKIRLYTNAKMHENLSLYPSLGYREIERRHEDGFDRVFFEKTMR